MKQAMQKQTQLHYPDLQRSFVLHMDASNHALGATLSQANDAGDLQLVTCTSRKLNPAERNYTTHEKEMLALNHALKKWKHYLLGSRINVYTDNAALKYWRTAQNLSPRQIRWVKYMQTFDIEITHIPGNDNTAADALSRLCPMLSDEARDDWKQSYINDEQLKDKYFLPDGQVIDENIAAWKNMERR